MRHEDMTEQAALYALGILDPAEVWAFEEHLAGCGPCKAEVSGFRETAATLAAAAPPANPPARLRDRVLAAARPNPQVWRSWTASPFAGLHVVRRDEGDWETVFDGVWAKQLHADPGADTVTMLIRMAPGATYPAHRHGGAEQCLVLEGDVEVNDVELKAGDYQCAARDSLHGVTRTDNGCLLLIVSSQRDELL